MAGDSSRPAAYPGAGRRHSDALGVRSASVSGRSVWIRQSRGSFLQGRARILPLPSVMRLQFDRGTILITDVAGDVDLGEAPGVLWDPRVHAHPVPASGDDALKAWLPGGWGPVVGGARAG